LERFGFTVEVEDLRLGVETLPEEPDVLDFLRTVVLLLVLPDELVPDELLVFVRPYRDDVVPELWRLVVVVERL
jgi:hypothetical protein